MSTSEIPDDYEPDLTATQRTHEPVIPENYRRAVLTDEIDTGTNHDDPTVEADDEPADLDDLDQDDEDDDELPETDEEE